MVSQMRTIRRLSSTMKKLQKILDDKSLDADIRKRINDAMSNLQRALAKAYEIKRGLI